MNNHMKMPKLSKRAIIIGAAILGVLLFVGIVIVIFPKLTYIGTQIANIVDEITDEANDATETNTRASKPQAGYQEEIRFKTDLFDLIIKPNGILTEVTPPVSLFVQSDPDNHIYDPDERVKCYEAGTVSGEMLELTGQENGRVQTITIEEGTKYYVAIYQEYETALGWTGRDGAGWYTHEEPVKYFLNDGRVYIINETSFLTIATEIGIGEISQYTADSNPEDYVDDESYEQEKSLLENNVENLVAVYDSYDPVLINTYGAEFLDESSLVVYYYYFTSTKGAQYHLAGTSVELPSELVGYTEIDDYHGLKILVNARKEFVLIDREGFAQELQFQAPLDGYVTGEFQMVEDSVFIGTYTSSYGTCEISSDATKDYVFEDIADESLQKVATTKGFDIYEKRDAVNDVFTRKVYDEDYIGTEYWEYNDLENDNEVALSYSEFLTYHPVIYVKDVYGEYIRYTNTNFFPDGGCAKPAIYLYPEEVTDISVKVMPNGELTFTYPRYGSGWNVIADPDGTLINKADGKLYKYLWWDSYTYKLDVPEEGFVVERVQIANFLETKLSEMNLNDGEKTEFKSYWIPKIQFEDSEYVYISFLFNEEVDQIAKLEVSPVPSNIFRVFMIYKAVGEDTIVKPLSIKSASRDGYTLIEWGGAEI